MKFWMKNISILLVVFVCLTSNTLGACGGACGQGCKTANSSTLPNLRAAVKDCNSVVSAAAIRAILDWPNAEALNDVYEIARDPAKPAYRNLAVRSYLRMVAAVKYSSIEGLERYFLVADLATRDAEKKLLLAGISKIDCFKKCRTSTVEKVREFVDSCLDRPALREEAVAVAIKIANAIRENDVYAAQKLAKKAMAVSKDDATKKQVQEILNQIEEKVKAGFQVSPHEKAEGFIPLFNGNDLAGWIGETDAYFVENGKIVCPATHNGKPFDEDIYTEKQYGNFELRFEYKLTDGANNGLGIRVLRAPGAEAVYAGMEIQILDDTAAKFNLPQTCLKLYQNSGSIYGVVPAKTGHTNRAGQWNYEEVIANGRQITVKLNGVIIVDADIDKASTPKTLDGNKHPGLKRKAGHISFLGHRSKAEFRNIRIRELK